MPAEVVGVKDVLAGLKFIDKDLQDRIRTAIDPLMRNVDAKARSFVPGNAEVLSGWTKEPNPEINFRPFPKYDAGTERSDAPVPTPDASPARWCVGTWQSRHDDDDDEERRNDDEPTN